MAELCRYVDICIANEEDAADVFGIHAENTDAASGALNYVGYESVVKELAARFGFQKVAVTLRQSRSANDNGWSAMLYSGGACYFSKKYAVHIVDRVGGGDSFASGLIYGLMTTGDAEFAVNCGAAHGALAMTTPGDTSMATCDEVMKLMKGGGARVDR